MKNKNIENLCRVCSQQASHTLFDKIPAYLHENQKDAGLWKMPINFLLTKVTNLPIKKNDGLPQNICVLCISYLMHAYNFRKQALANFTVFKIKQMTNTDLGKYNGSLSIFNNTTPRRKQPMVAEPSSEISKNQIQYNKKFEVIDKSSPNEFDGIDDPSSAKKSKPKVHGYFSFAEKSFEEDDVTLMDMFQGNKTSDIQFSVPENNRERKCMSCRRRFMFDDSFNAHVNECIQLKLEVFIEDINNLLVLKKNHRISPHDSIRRMIFAVKKCSTFLKTFDHLPAELLEPSREVSGDEEESAMEKVVLKPPQPQPSEVPKPVKEPLLLNVYNKKPKATLLPSPLQPTKFTTNCDTCELTFDSVANLEIHNFKFHNKQKAASTKTLPMAESMTVAQLAQRQQLLDLFENDNFNVDYLSKLKTNKLNNTNVNGDTAPTTAISAPPINSIKNNLKLVKCQQCADRFYTISHLDEHVVRKHPQFKQQNNDLGRRRAKEAKETSIGFNFYN